ncbi:MAG: hypothetical protein IIC74_03395 [Bacteroidetes bacterium]|nr:hypothetical protein [Bacteroidota bacterium]
MSIKNWLSDKRHIRNHDKEAKRLNSELKKRYYKPKSNSIIKILSEIEKKAGLSGFDIVPFLIEIKLMSSKYSLIEESSGGSVTDRKRNSELFNELEELGFIRIIENKLYSYKNEIKYPTPVENCELRVKLLPRGIDYLIENRKKKTDNYFKIVTMVLLFIMGLFAIPQACNNWEQYKLLDNTEKNTEISQSKP